MTTAVKSIRLGSLILSIVGLGFLAAALFFWVQAKKFVDTASTAQGTVVELIRRTSQKGSETYAPMVAFVTHTGEQRTFLSSIGSKPAYFSVGESVEVLYNVTDARINTLGQLWLGPSLAGGFGVAFLSGRFGIFLFRRLREKTAKGLKV